MDVTGGQKARIIQCLRLSGCENSFFDPAEAAHGLLPTERPDENIETENPDEAAEPSDDGDDQLSTIHEDPEEDEVDIVMESFYQELVSDDILEELNVDADIPIHPIQMLQEGTVLVAVTTEDRHTFYSGLRGTRIPRTGMRKSQGVETRSLKTILRLSALRSSMMKIRL